MQISTQLDYPPFVHVNKQLQKKLSINFLFVLMQVINSVIFMMIS